MKRFLSVILIYSVSLVTASSQQAGPSSGEVIHVATAVNHLTVLEFHEPVTLAAAGSSDFQIERQENKVFVKPVKAGVSTDLFVWTASKRFAYELETTSEVKAMNFAIDNSPAPVAQPVVSGPSDQLADMMLTRAFLGAIEITPVTARTPKSQVNVRVLQVFRTRSSVYVHYTIENNGKREYHVQTPEARELHPNHPAIFIPGLLHRQLDQHLVDDLRNPQGISLPIAHSEYAAQSLAPGQTTQGVVAIRQDLSSPAVVELIFGGDVRATFVL